MTVSHETYKLWYERILDVLQHINCGIIGTTEEAEMVFTGVRDEMVATGQSILTYHAIRNEVLSTETMSEHAMKILDPYLRVVLNNIH
jgi:hypothetical protein